MAGITADKCWEKLDWALKLFLVILIKTNLGLVFSVGLNVFSFNYEKTFIRIKPNLLHRQYLLERTINFFFFNIVSFIVFKTSLGSPLF